MSRSVATIDSPEFINVVPYNPLISKCEIKVLYIGENRNQSYISKEVAREMANSLPGCPIVGYYKEEKEDFTDHGNRMTIDGDGVHFETLTKPYGFVAPDAKVWFKLFDDTDEFGNVTQREYLMTTGYLWTGQYEEAKRVIEQGNNQSMELDEEFLDGKWATNNNTGVKFFIINDAIISKLAILGENVEPCFEGAEITAPKISASFSLDEEFKTTLFTMMQDLKDAIESNEGGLNMTKQELIDSGKKPSEYTVEERELFNDAVDEYEALVEAEEAEKAAVIAAAEEEARVEYEARLAAEQAEAEEAARLEAEAAAARTVEENFALLQTQFEELQTRFETLETETVQLREFKNGIEDSQKDTLIQSFYMLSDEDKSDVVANKSNYSLEEIESKLAVICVRNKVSFEDTNHGAPGLDSEGNPIVTFSLGDQADTAPAFVQVLRNVKQN